MPTADHLALLLHSDFLDTLQDTDTATRDDKTLLRDYLKPYNSKHTNTELSISIRKHPEHSGLGVAITKD